ncbi:MAG TPA: sugar phosphate nucleotidyltransferase, partial [Thermoanaerobaculia bacterium]|nr:sugar phosphate nucleotidyltransferase [Thermoanaerobaculia bacterium]
RFVEKPKREAAERMVAAGGHYWNAGMFVWRVDEILRAYEKHLPRTAKALDALREAIGSPRYESVLAEVWEETDRTTVDYGIAEKAENVAVVPADIGWQDVGSWARLAAIVSKSENWASVSGDLVAEDAHDNYVWSPGKTVALIGVEGLVVVDTEDALLITPKDRSEEVKTIVDRLKREEREDVL